MSKKSKRRNSLSHNGNNLPLLDALDVSIIKEMVNDADVKSAVIASRYKSPLSTVQRRRAKLERTILKKKYHIDIGQLGWRNADLMISVDKGNCEQVAKKLLEERSSNVVATSLRIGDPQVNVMAQVFYKNSEELHNLMEDIRSMTSVTSVEWAEVVRIVGSNNIGMIDAVFDGSAR
jgi:DNA-binding Lrp family transcriptional regulator